MVMAICRDIREFVGIAVVTTRTTASHLAEDRPTFVNVILQAIRPCRFYAARIERDGGDYKPRSLR